MNRKHLFVAFLLLATGAFAQAGDGKPNPLHDSEDLVGWLRHPSWNFEIWGDYSNGVGTRTDVHAGGAGIRLGRVLTNEHGSSVLRGTFEYDIDLTPVEIYHLPAYQPLSSPVLLPAKNYYTGGFDPFVAKWNFTKGSTWAPYIAAEGGIVFSNGNLPQGDTDNVNFTSGAAFGVHHFVSDRGAWTFQGKIFHLSNASLGPHNPGINAAVQFKIGYTWFKR